jgi:serine/threonine-protein kinase
VKKILIFAANPKDTNKLRLDEEVREIQTALKLSKEREQFQIISEWAVRPDDVRRALLEHEPQVVHFSGHGAGERGLVLEDETGQAQLVSAGALARLFKLFASKIQCVLLNACYSEVQADAIAQQIDYVIGMNQAIGDRAAIKFAVGFYDALGYGRSFEEAYEFGLSAIDLQGIPETSTPVLKAKPHSSSFPKETELAIDSEVPAPIDSQTKRVFLSYRAQDPDRSLAYQFYQAIQEAGHIGFMAGESIRLGENWSERIDKELEGCDYFLLLLSEQSAVSEMVTEEVRRAKQLRDLSPTQKPIILPIRVNFPMSSPLNYDLRGYLQRIQQRQWTSAADTPKILQEVLSLFATGETPQLTEPQERPIVPEDSPDTPPLPIAEPELYREPGGVVPLVSNLYVERQPIETDCYREILQPGALIRIKAPRQMGKTSLMARILNYAKEQGYEAIPLSFQRADSQLFTNLDQFLRWFCEQVGRRLKRLNQLEDYWQGYGSKDKCNAYLEECILGEIDSPIVLGLDEVDLVFPHQEIADDFFGLLRSWYESARYGDFGSELWEKLRLVVVHSTEAYIPLNINQSPFNVGMTVELPEFNQAQVRDLARRYGLSWGDSQVKQLMSLVGGHPYLIRKALYHIRRQDVTLEQLAQTAPTEAGFYTDHLRRHLFNLQRYPQLAAALRQTVVRGKSSELDSEASFKLESMGLIRLQGDEAILRCELYRSYFRAHLKA